MQPPSYDGPVSRYVNRRISRPIARLIARTPITPNQVSVVSALIAALAAYLLIRDQLLLAAFAIQASSIIDGVDGDVARLRGMTSRFGAIFDAILDRYADAVIILGMAIWAQQHESKPAMLIVAFAALSGALLVSYSRARTEASAQIRLSEEFLGLISRDVRMLLLAVGTAFAQVYWTLALVAVLSHLTVAWRVLLLRRALPRFDHDGDL